MSKASDQGKRITINPRRETVIVVTSMPVSWQITTPVHVVDGRKE